MLARDVVAGGRAIRPFIGDLARDPALSPERSPAPNVPVFLLHGRDDNVIPATETPRLAEYLQSHRTPEVQWLLTPILSHIGIDRSPAVLDVWRLVRFWRALDDRVTR
jgi:pimeloyl-ACP methyl ester carboxylesterase